MAEKQTRRDLEARSGEADARRTWRDWLAVLILGLFVVQSIARFASMVVFYPERPALAVYHLAMLGALAAAAALLLLNVPLTRLGRISVAAILATISFLLWSFDLLALASARFGSTFFSFRFLADNWCASSLDGACLARYPLVFLAAGISILVATAVYLLVYRELRRWVAKTLAATERFPLVRRVGSRKLLGAAIVGCTAWNALAFDAWRDEPLHALFLSQFELGPSELLVGAVPKYRPAATPDVKPRPLVLIIVDSMRADKINLEPGTTTLTPFLRSLAANGTLHEVAPAFSVCPSTYCGILGTLMSGTWADMQSRKGPTISQALHAEGYRSFFVLSGNHTRFVNMRAFYGPDLAYYSDDISSDDRSVITRLNQLTFAYPRRSFVLIHLMSTHLAGRRFFPKAAGQIDVRLAREALQQGRSRGFAEFYQQGMRQADEVIRHIFAALDRKRMLSDAVVIITSDHGERIGERGLIGHLGTPDPIAANIPLLIYDAHKTYPTRPIASHADVAPTLLQAIGASIPRQWSGEPVQQASVRTAVAVDSREVTGAAFRHRGKSWFYTCNRSTGDEIVWEGGKQQAWQLAPPSALVAGRRALHSLSRRKDAAKCRR